MVAFNHSRTRGRTPIFTLAEAFPRISRVYIHNWLGVADPAAWDAGLVTWDSKPRPALDVVRRYVRRG
jgi:hypothetical protein